MEGKVKITGLEDAIAAMGAAFPSNAEQQRRLLNQTISGSARKSIIPIAKQLAYRGDSSGSLSEAIAPRAVSRGKAMARGATASIHITPVRSNRKALARYIEYYYTRLGKTPKASIVTSGIRHGHLVEFGTTKSSARPFMYPALRSGLSAYINIFSATLKKKIESAVRRRARKGK